MNERQLRRAVHGSVAYQIIRALAVVLLIGLLLFLFNAQYFADNFVRSQ